jgi:hypothetical protein
MYGRCAIPDMYDSRLELLEIPFHAISSWSAHPVSLCPATAATNYSWNYNRYRLAEERCGD